MSGMIEPQGHIAVSKKDKLARIKNCILKEVKTRKIPFIADAKTVLLFDPTASQEEILASIDILRKDIVLRTKK